MCAFLNQGMNIFYIFISILEYNQTISFICILSLVPLTSKYPLQPDDVFPKRRRKLEMSQYTSIFLNIIY